MLNNDFQQCLMRFTCHYALLGLPGGKSLGKSTNSVPNRRMPFKVVPIMLPQNNINSKFSVLYSCGKITDAQNIAIANANIDGNWTRKMKMKMYISLFNKQRNPFEMYLPWPVSIHVALLTEMASVFLHHLESHSCQGIDLLHPNQTKRSTSFHWNWRIILNILPVWIHR